MSGISASWRVEVSRCMSDICGRNQRVCVLGKSEDGR
jgi:hypothetical protein